LWMTSQIGPLPKKPDCGGTPFNYYKSQVCFRWPDPLTTCDIFKAIYKANVK